MYEQNGVILDFYKRKIYEDTVGYNNFQFDYYILGYYSGLNIFPVNNWFGFAPHGVQEAKSGKDETFFETYPIKLSCLCEKQKKLSEELGAKYQQINNNIEKRNPLFSVMLLNLTDYGIRQCMSSPNHSALEQFLTVFKNKEKRFPDKDIEVAIFPCIGYYDFAIICHSKSFEHVYALQHLIKKLSDDGKPYIGNLHIIHGINLKYPNLGREPFKDQKITLRFTLRPGISFIDLKDCLKGEFPKLTGELVGTHGRSDSILLCTLTIKEFVVLLNKFGQLQQKDNKLKKYITTFRASIRYNSEDLQITSEEVEHNIIEDSKAKDAIEDLQKKYSNILPQLSKLNSDLFIHERAVHALIHTTEICYSLLSLPYSLEMREIVRPVFESMLRNLDSNISLIYNYKVENDNESVQEYIYYLLEFIENYRLSVGQYVIDLLHCDRFFLEGLTLLHPSVGSATKLLFAYNRVLNYASKKLTVCTSAPMEPKCYSFLVTSGGCDITYANILNNYIPISEDGEHYKEDRIIVLKISERSLFDISGTLFRIMHECMHFCGNRLRQFRAESIHKTFCRFFTVYFLGISMAYEKLEPIEVTTNVKIQNACANLRKDIISQFAAQLDKKLEEAFAFDFDDLELYGNILVDKLKMHYTSQIMPKADEISKCTEILYNARSKARYDLIVDIDEMCTKENIHSRAGLYMSENRAYLNNCLCEGEDADNSKKFINRRFLKSCLDFQRVVSGIENNGFNVEDRHLQEHLDVLPTVSELLNEIFEGFSESFCDIMACTLLNLPLEDYLLAFIFEQWDVEIALPCDYMGHILRIGAVLHIKYHSALNEQGVLSNEAKQKIKDSFTKHVNDGWWFPNKDNLPQKIIDSVDFSLKKYQEGNEILYITEPLEEYLNECIKCENLNKDLCKEISDLYKKIVNMGNCTESAKSLNEFLSFQRMQTEKE